MARKTRETNRDPLKAILKVVCALDCPRVLFVAEQVASVQLLVTLLMGLFLKLQSSSEDQSSNSNSNNNTSQSGFGVLLVSMNVFVIVCALYTIVKTVLGMRDTASAFREHGKMMSMLMLKKLGFSTGTKVSPMVPDPVDSESDFQLGSSSSSSSLPSSSSSLSSLSARCHTTSKLRNPPTLCIATTASRVALATRSFSVPGMVESEPQGPTATKQPSVAGKCR